MPRYYFHVRRGQVTVLDQEGIELANLVEAAKEAARRVLDVEESGTLKDLTRSDGSIIVDDDYCTILAVPFDSSKAALRARPAPLIA